MVLTGSLLPAQEFSKSFCLLVGWFCFCQGDGASLTEEKAGGYPGMKPGTSEAKCHLNLFKEGELSLSAVVLK